LDRLKGTTIKNNVVAGRARIKHAFGLIDDWRIVERPATDERMIGVEVTLSEWLYNAIAAREVLTLNRDYFRLGGALEPRRRPADGGKMIQTMQPIPDSRIVAARVAMDQLEALGAEYFDIGIKRVDGTMVLREGWGAKQVLKSLLWLRRENLNRGHIYVRPVGAHEISLVDDLKADTFVRMKADGFAPAAVVETSPGNFQAWLKHGEVLDEAASTRAAKLLAERYGGDPGSADWRHFGRLAGFTNPKPSRRLASGLQPFARLLEANGQVYRQAPLFIAEVRAALAGEGAMVGGGGGRAGEGAPELPPIKPLARFHSDVRYDGDLHRADLAWARHAADMGLSASEIRATIMEARDLAKKGSIKRQREYAERTAGKATRQAE
jgi:hypothetical protein